MTTKPTTVISLFSGLGGLDLGFKEEGFQIVWANDISESAVKTYRMNFGKEAVCADITKMAPTGIPEAEVIIGGPPCQSFSLMGRRDPADPNGKLVFTFLEIVKAKRPLAFVMENVPGMAASKINGVRLPDILQLQFRSLGYNVVKIPVLASDYLVPQARRRLVLIGCLGRTPEMMTPETYAREALGIDPEGFDVSAQAAIGDLGPCAPRGKRALYSSRRPSAFAQLMRSAGLRDCSLHECPRMSDTDKLLVAALPPGGNYMDIPDEIAPGRVLKYKKSGGRTTTYGRLHPDRPAYTINTYFRRPNVGCNFHYSEPRLITPREAMRFQSIPDHFEVAFTSQDERNGLIGNAVPPLLARALASSLKRTLALPARGDDRPMVGSTDAVQLPLIG
jgi:DNA (cytosine-5)-methyltransferase 1